MAKYSYKDYTFEVDHTPTPEEFQQMQDYVDSLPLKQNKISNDSWSDTYEKNLLSPLLGMSRAFGGASPEAHRSSVLEAEGSAQEHPTAAFAGKASAALGPLVAGAGPLALVSPMTGGVGLTSLGGMGTGVAGGAMTAPIVGPQMGMETYEQQKIKGTPENEARSAGITSGVVNAAANMIPLPGATWGKRALMGAGLNVAADIGDKSLQNLLISNPKNRPDILDPSSLALNALIGGVTEGLGGNRVGDKMIDSRRPSTELPTPDVKKTLLASAVKNVENKLNLVKQKEQELQGSDNLSPDLQKEQEFLYQQRLKLESDLEHLNSIMGVPKEETVSGKWTLEEKQQRYDDLKSLANSGVKLTDKQIDLFDSLGVELERASKRPTEATLRPLEAPKVEEPIPTSELVSLKPLEEPTKPLNEHPPGNVNWDRSQEWKSTSTPDADIWSKYGEIFDEVQQQKATEEFLKDRPIESRNPIEPKGPQYKLGDPKLGKQLEYQINKLESIRDRLKKQEQDYKDGITPSGTLEESKLAQRLRWIEDKLDNVLYPLREEHINTPPIKTEIKPITAERVKTFNQNVANQIYKLQQSINKLRETPQTEATQKQILRLQDKIANKKQSMDRLEAQLRKQESSGLPTIDASLLDVENVSPIQKYSHVSDILIAEKHPIDAFINNPELFDTVTGKDTHVDKELVRQAPGIVETVEAFVKDLGLDLDKLYIIDSDRSEIKFQGNSAVIHIDLKTHLTNRDVYMNNPKTRPIVEKLSPENYAHFVVAKVVGHEFGHYIFTKWLKFDNVTNERFTTLIQGFNDWAKKNKIEPISWLNSLNRAEYQKYHSLFDEYFAERTADSLIRTTLLDRFSDKRFKIAKQIRSVVDTMTFWLNKQGIKINKFDAVEDIIQDIRNRNAESIKKSGEVLWNKTETEQNDKLILYDKDNTYPFANKTLQQIREKPFEVFDKNNNPIKWQHKEAIQDMPDVVNFSLKALDFIGGSGPWLARKLFGKTTLAGIFKNNQILQDAHHTIRSAELKASNATNNLWYLDISFSQWKDAPILQRFSKVKLPDSPMMVWKSLTNIESFRLHEVFKRGWEEGLEYQDSLTKYGQHFSDKEKNAFLVFGTMMDRAFTHQKSLERSLGKKDIIQKAPGYYPAMRRGDYFVNIRFGDTVAHRQHFNTQVAAEAWVKKMEPQLGNHFEMGLIENVKDGPKHPGVFEMIDVFDSYLYNKYNVDVSHEAAELKLKLATRGGRMGHHHDQRFNISGYKGSELGFTPEELGHSFKQGIQDYVQEFQSQYKAMIIKHEIDPILETQGLRDSHPQTHAAMQQIRDSALNFNPNKFEAFDKAIYESTDKMARAIYESLYPNKLFNPKDPVYKTIQSAAISTFYLFKVLPSLAMSVVQLLNPVIAMRHGAIDNGFLTIGSFGKGMYKLFTGDSELMQSLHQVTQTTDVIEPQFLNTLHMKGENKLLEGVKDWVAMRKPQEACDVISRTMGYAYFYTHYKDIGHTPLEAKNLALEAIDANFGAYTRGESAPIFQHLGGIIGEGLRPLQTFGQMTVGNIVADVKRMADNPTKLKSYAPFIMYGLTATLLGGAITGPVMNMYETTRQFFMKLWPEWDIPSALDLVLKGVISLDNVVEDKDALTKLIAYGVLSQQTGIDIGASARTTETLPGTLLSLGLAAVEGENAASAMAKEVSRLTPVHSNVVHMASGATTLAKSLVKDVPKNELKQGITDAAMRGPMKNALMEATGANKTTVMGKDTNMIASGSDSSALMEEGPKEKVAHWMGNMSTEERFRTDQKIEDQFRTKAFNDKIKQMFTLYNQTLKPEYLDRLIQLGATDANIKNQLQTRAYKALVPADIREVTNNKGKVPNNLSSVRKIEHQGLFNFRR